MDNKFLDEFRIEFVTLVRDRVEAMVMLLAKSEPTRDDQYDSLLIMHNLKGAASSLGFSHVAGLCHAMEDMLAGDGFEFLASRPTLLQQLDDLIKIADAELAGDVAALESLPSANPEMVEHLSFLIYASTRRNGVTIDLEELLRQARQSNRDRLITGILLFSGYHFVQVLEGGRQVINETFGRIARDDRHDDVQLLCVDEIGERRFGDWSMAYLPDSQACRERISALTGDDRFAPHGYPARTLLSLVQSLHAAR